MRELGATIKPLLLTVAVLAAGCAGAPTSGSPTSAAGTADPGRFDPSGGMVASSAGRSDPGEGRLGHPLVLVHGAFGFGREELWGYRYWGGTVDLQEQLRRRGYETFTAAVGPVSSNWDRACELYACLKGGRVDYGEAHSRRYGHERYGRRYPGLYPQWGTPEPIAGRIRRVHLIGHSLGGQTVRVLVQLLVEGSPEEREAAGGRDLSPLFDGGHDWVASVTTISSPHDGTTATVRFASEDRPLEATMGLLLAAAGTSRSRVFDFKLDQWGLGRSPESSALSFRRTVAASAVWRNLEDTSLWDGSPEGARELNRWVRAQPGVFYFSWATEETYRDPISGTRVPGWGMNPNMLALSSFLGSYLCDDPARVPIDRSWWPNDGLVNTCSMDGPTLGSDDRIVPYPGPEAAAPLRGVWNYMGVLESIDHLDIIGLDPLWREHPRGSGSLVDWYSDLAEMLIRLPE
jgi:triacylglycerol lipase